jgi:hypothetical protein
MLSVILALIVVGVLLYCVNSLIPMDARVKQILNIVVILFLVIWLLQVFGLIGSIHNVATPIVR